MNFRIKTIIWTYNQNRCNNRCKIEMFVNLRFIDENQRKLHRFLHRFFEGNRNINHRIVESDSKQNFDPWGSFVHIIVLWAQK